MTDFYTGVQKAKIIGMKQTKKPLESYVFFVVFSFVNSVSEVPVDDVPVVNFNKEDDVTLL